MGTRNLTLVYQDNKTKVAQYGQWDGYPSGQGVDILNFLRQANLKEFENKIKQVEWITDDKLDFIHKAFGMSEEGWMTMDQGEKMREIYPELSRDTGGKILQLIYDGKAKELVNSENFKTDNLFCEWYYEIDLDKYEWRVYDSGKLVRTYELNKLPTAEDFINSFKSDD